MMQAVANRDHEDIFHTPTAEDITLLYDNGYRYVRKGIEFASHAERILSKKIRNRKDPWLPEATGHLLPRDLILEVKTLSIPPLTQSELDKLREERERQNKRKRAD